MAKKDCRLERMTDEYQSVRNAQDKSFEEKAQELIETVTRNNDMLDAIIEHLGVPYKRRRITINRPRLKRGERHSTMTISAGLT